MTSSPHSIRQDAPSTPRAATALKQSARRLLPHLAAFSLAINILALALPLFVLQVFDRVLTSHSMSTLWVLAAGCVLALTVMAALDVIRSRILSRWGQGLERDLAPTIVAAGQTDALPDLARLRAFMAGPAMASLLDIPWTPLFIAVAFVVHPVVGWIALGGAAALLAIAWVAELHLRAPHVAAGKAEAEARWFAEAASAHGVYGPAKTAQDMADKWSAVQEPAWHARLMQADRGGIYAVAARFLRLVLQVTVIAVAAVLAVGGEITAGGMIASLVLLARAMAPYERAQDLWRGLVAARISLARLLALSPSPAASERRSFVLAPEENIVLDLRNVLHIQNGAVEPTFAGIRFKARAGEIIGITGPSGAGKSTLLSLIAGQESADRGRILLNGQDMVGSDGRRLDADIGYLPQAPGLLPGTVAENIAAFSDADIDAVIDAARLAGVDDAVRALPEGYETRVGPAGMAIPAGLRQGIALAAAMYGRPRLLLLDEPYTHLDNGGVECLISAIDELRRDGSLAVVISQRPSVLAHCSRVLLMDGGRAKMIDRRRKAELRVLTNDQSAIAEAAPMQVEEADRTAGKARKKAGV